MKFKFFIVYFVGVLALMVYSGFRFTPLEVDKKAFPNIPSPFAHSAVQLSDQDMEANSNFRGSADRKGVATQSILPQDLELSWEKKPLNIGVHSASKSTPAVDDTGVYVGADSGWFYAYDHTGNLKWKFFSDDAKYGFHSTAALDQKRVYVGDYKGQFYAFDKKSGKLHWAVRLGETIGASPLLYKKTILVTVETNQPRNGYLVRINQQDGSLIWRSDYLGEQSHSSVSVDKESNIAVVGANNSQLFALDLADGKTKWKVDLDGKIKATAMIHEGVSFIPTWNGSLYAINNEDGSTVWKADIGGRAQGSVTWVPDLELVVVGSKVGKIFCFDAKTGQKKWEIGTQTWSSQMASGLSVRKESGGVYRVWMACAENKFCSIDPRFGRVEKRLLVDNFINNSLVTYKNTLYVAPTSDSGLQKWVPTK